MVDSPLQQIVCCMGQPVAGNPTQFMMETAFAKAGLDWRYLTLEVGPHNLGDAVRGIKAMGFQGANFTIPHKVAVVELLDDLSDAARLMGAVNCVFLRDGQLIGDNTDGKGFLTSLRTLVEPAGQRIVILGAGGAARAIAVELALADCGPITIVNRCEDRGRELAALVDEHTPAEGRFEAWQGETRIPDESDIVINATSIGLSDPDARVPIDAASLNSGQVVADVIFNPPDTQFLSEARAAGCRTLDGLGMLVNQGVISFQLWTGVDPDREAMREALEEYLEI